MAYHESEVPESVRDILAHMPREMRQRVLADYESHYAPFLAMLAGWKGAIHEHFVLGEASVIAQLEEQFFPIGEWKCPSQTLAVAQRPPERTADIDGDTQFVDPIGRPWMSCGSGWLQPTVLRAAQAQFVNQDCFIVIEADYRGTAPLEPLLRRGQLAFAAVPEDLVPVLAASPWWVQTANGFQAARLTRHDGYMAFEREMHAARMNQRHLDFWLPAYYPYSRKIVCLRLDGDAAPVPSIPELNWLGRSGMAGGFRFVGRLNPVGARAQRAVTSLRRAGSAPLFHLNPVPVTQTALADGLFYPPFSQVGEQYALRLKGTPSLMAAVAQQDSASVPVSVVRLPSTDPKATERDVQVQFFKTAAKPTRVKLYHSSRGQLDTRDAPSIVETVTTKQRFDVPYPCLGGATIGGQENRAEWARTAWYHSVLRPPLLTEGDLAELVRQRTGAVGDQLRFHRAAREVALDPEGEHVHWRSYLWPSVVASQDSFDARYGEIPAPEVIPLVQTLRVSFKPEIAAANVPPFLLADAANYLASVLSQYFVLSCFRVEGQVV